MKKTITTEWNQTIEIEEIFANKETANENNYKFTFSVNGYDVYENYRDFNETKYALIPWNELKKAIDLIVNDIKKDIDENQDIETWKEYLNNTGQTLKDFKENADYLLKENNIFLNTDYELEVNGELVSFKKILSEVKKQLKAEGYLK